MKIIKQPMNKLLLDAMNINKRYNRPFQLKGNVTRTMAILRYVSAFNSGFCRIKQLRVSLPSLDGMSLSSILWSFPKQCSDAQLFPRKQLFITFFFSLTRKTIKKTTSQLHVAQHIQFKFFKINHPQHGSLQENVLKLLYIWKKKKKMWLLRNLV